MVTESSFGNDALYKMNTPKRTLSESETNDSSSDVRFERKKQPGERWKPQSNRYRQLNPQCKKTSTSLLSPSQRLTTAARESRKPDPSTARREGAFSNHNQTSDQPGKPAMTRGSSRDIFSALATTRTSPSTARYSVNSPRNHVPKRVDIASAIAASQPVETKPRPDPHTPSHQSTNLSSKDKTAERDLANSQPTAETPRLPMDTSLSRPLDVSLAQDHTETTAEHKEESSESMPESHRREVVAALEKESRMHRQRNEDCDHSDVFKPTRPSYTDQTNDALYNTMDNTSPVMMGEDMSDAEQDDGNDIPPLSMTTTTERGNQTRPDSPVSRTEMNRVRYDRDSEMQDADEIPREKRVKRSHSVSDGPENYYKSPLRFSNQKPFTPVKRDSFERNYDEKKRHLAATGKYRGQRQTQETNQPADDDEDQYQDMEAYFAGRLNKSVSRSGFEPAEDGEQHSKETTTMGRLQQRTLATPVLSSEQTEDSFVEAQNLKQVQADADDERTRQRDIHKGRHAARDVLQTMSFGNRSPNRMQSIHNDHSSNNSPTRRMQSSDTFSLPSSRPVEKRYSTAVDYQVGNTSIKDTFVEPANFDRMFAKMKHIKSQLQNATTRVDIGSARPSLTPSFAQSIMYDRSKEPNDPNIEARLRRVRRIIEESQRHTQRWYNRLQIHNDGPKDPAGDEPLKTVKQQPRHIDQQGSLHRSDRLQSVLADNGNKQKSDTPVNKHKDTQPQQSSTTTITRNRPLKESSEKNEPTPLPRPISPDEGLINEETIPTVRERIAKLKLCFDASASN